MHEFAGARCERVIHVPISAYYDGAADGKATLAVTLTGVAAMEDAWKEFECKWAEALRPLSSFHMAPFMASKGMFDGWDESRKATLISKLWNVVGALRNQIWAYTCTVLIQDWNRAKSKIPGLCSQQSICVNFCVGGIQLPIECAGEAKPIVLYFDRNEKFMHKVNRVWLRRRKAKGTFFNQIRNIIPVDNSKRPIQLADMLAWIASNEAIGRNYPERERFAISSLLMIEHFRKVYDYDAILAEYPSGTLLTSRRQ